jgi:hypothetical protein
VANRLSRIGLGLYRPQALVYLQASAAALKFLHRCRKFVQELQIRERYWKIWISSVLSNPKFAGRARRDVANFGFGTLGQVRLETG